ncbi:MAG TPA: FG-GAP-like repeat-containing protein, partial [Xanthobacteraceae bacterium]
MAILSINNAIDGLTEGSTVNVGAAGGVLATDTDPFGAALAVSAVGFNNQTTNVTAGTAVIAGSYGTLTMRANGSYSYSALNNISLPAIGFVQDHFTIAVTDAQGNAGQATLTITVTQAGVQYVAAAAGATVTIGNAATVVDASLGNVTVKGGNGNDVVIGGANDTITLGNGNDTVLAGTNDTIKVGNGNDTVVGGANDAITLGNGNDTVAGGSGDSVTAGNGNDAIAVGANSAVTAGNGNDTVTAGNNSSVKAGNGTDTITAGNNSTVAAGNGNDAITAGSNSTVAAGNGTDTITAGAGSTVSAGNHAAIAPTLSIPTTLTVNEDGSIAVPITVSVGSTSETVTVRISGIPSDATLRNSSGPLTVTNGSITLTKAQLAGLTLTAGEVTSVTLTVTATGVFGADSATVNGTIALTVNPVAPTLSIANQILSVNEDGTVALGIVETPFDPRDVVSLTIAGVPSDATLSAGINNGNGTWTLTPAQLAGLALRAGEETTATLTITATNTQGATAAISKTIALTVNPVAEAPILTIPGGKFSFAAPVSYAAGSGPEDLAVDTINGAAAVVTSNIQGGTISLLQGDGAGHLGSPASFASGGSSPNALVLGDFNQDGVADVAVVNQDGGGASVLLGNADGTFGSPTELANSSSNPNSLATGDFNGDGKLDLLLGESVGSQLLYYQGNGNGTFQSPVALASGQQVAGIAVGDVNHDGKSDILAFVGTGNPGAAQILEILSNGTGTFGAPNVLASLPGTEGSLALADLQGNGVLDLIAAPVNSRGIVVMKGDGDGGFGPPVTYGTVNPTNDREAMVVGDFNGDGKLDVAVVNAGMGVAFFAGNGDGTFQPEADISVPGATALAAGDLNGDGHPDLVVSNTAGNVVDVLISQPTSAEATTEDTPLTIDGIMLAAVDADDALSMNLSVVHGALTLGSTAGLTITSDGTNGTLAFSGSQASISAALAGGVTYTPAGAFTGTDTLTVVGTATEGASSASSTQTIALTVTSGAQTLSVSILGDAQENATLTALASDTDANATIAYQWQRSTDGGSTWTPIDGANQANYVVQEGDEGDLIDVVATGTDSHTNQSATATSAQTAPVIDAPPILTPSFRFAADNLSINKNGTLIFNDTFAQAPPFAPSVTEQGTTTPVSFQTTSAFADNGTQAIMAPSGADTFEVALFDAQLLTNNDPTSELGLKQDSDFTVSATFDLTLPPPSSLLGVGFGHYGISLTDATATSTPDQVINFWVQNFNSATPTVTLQQSDPADGTFHDLADINLTAAQLAGNDQIAFHLSHVAGSTAITGSFDLIHDGTITSTTTLSGSTQLGTLFTNGVDWTQASINAFVAANVLVSGLPRVNSTLTASV